MQGQKYKGQKDRQGNANEVKYTMSCFARFVLVCIQKPLFLQIPTGSYFSFVIVVYMPNFSKDRIDNRFGVAVFFILYIHFIFILLLLVLCVLFLAVLCFSIQLLLFLLLFFSKIICNNSTSQIAFCGCLLPYVLSVYIGV